MRYNEDMEKNSIEGNSKSFNEDIDRSFFARTAMSFDLGKDKLLLNYNFFRSNNDENILSSGLLNNISFKRDNATDRMRQRQEEILTYQKRFDDADKKLDFKLSYAKINNSFHQDNQSYLLNSVPRNTMNLTNSSDIGIAEFKINYTQNIPLLDNGKIHGGGLYERFDFRTRENSIKNLDYQRQTIASFVELQTSKGQWDFLFWEFGENITTLEGLLIIQQKMLMII